MAGIEDDRLAATATAVTEAVRAIGAPSYVVGVLPPRGTPPEVAERMTTAHRTYSADSMMGKPLLKYLRAMNARGHDIYFRPAPREDGRLEPLVLVDDLTPAAVERMRAEGVTPCLTVSTSRRDNLQAWVRLGTASLDGDTLREVARDLAEQHGGDPHAAKAVQFGRLPGFTNRKPTRIAENGGRPPFARLVEAGAQVARAGRDMIVRAVARLHQAEAERAEVRRRQADAAARREREAAQGSAAESVARHWNRSAGRRGDGDMSALDFAAACGALRDGHDREAVRDALAAHTPDLGKRHTNPGDYIERTVEAAERAVAQDNSRQHPRGS